MNNSNCRQRSHEHNGLHTIAADSIAGESIARVAGTGVGTMCVGADVLAEMGPFITLMDL